jgi:hypothetical protein
MGGRMRRETTRKKGRGNEMISIITFFFWRHSKMEIKERKKARKEASFG